MADTSKTPDIVWLIAEQQGIARALEQYPDAVKAGAERGLKPVTLPPGTPAPDDRAARIPGVVVIA